jgi:hypothetical protein
MWRDQEGQDASSFQLSGCGHFKDQSLLVYVPEVVTTIVDAITEAAPQVIAEMIRLQQEAETATE